MYTNEHLLCGQMFQYNSFKGAKNFLTNKSDEICYKFANYPKYEIKVLASISARMTDPALIKKCLILFILCTSPLGNI